MAQVITDRGFAPDLEGVQRKLADLGLLPPGHITGEDDEETRAAVRAVQQDLGLRPTGALDVETRALLDGWWCGSVPPRPTATPGRAVGAERLEFSLSSGMVPWTRTELTYQIVGLPPAWDARDVVGGINQALAAWEAVTPLRFDQTIANADITFSFTGIRPDGTALPGWAAAWAQNNVITFNPGTVYTSQPVPLPALAQDLVQIALHEVGHVLGLGHATNLESVMYPVSQAGQRALSSDDIEGVQSLYGGRPVPVPGWFGSSSAAADLAVADLSGTGGLDVLVGHVDNPAGANQAYYRVGWQLDAAAAPTLGWGPITPIGGPLGNETQGMGLAVGDLNGSGRPDLVAVFMDAPSGENSASYRIGWDLDTSGRTATWSADLPIPGWWGHEAAGMAAALWDLDGSGSLDLVVAWIDAPDGENRVHYRIGRDLDVNGVATSWSASIAVEGGFGHVSSGLGIALTDFAGNGLPDLAVFWIDGPDGPNGGRLRYGQDLDGTGRPRRGWSGSQDVPGWWGNATSGAGAALAPLRGLTRPDLLVLHVDDPEGENRAHYRVLAPSLPTWNPLRQLRPALAADRLAAVTPSEDVHVLAVRTGVPAGITTATWDQVDLNEGAGSDVVEHAQPPGGPGPLGLARADSPVAVAARTLTQVDAFWIGADAGLRSSWAAGLGVAGNTGPVWQPAFAPGGAAAARAGSPLAAASIDEDHIEAFLVGPQDEVVGHRWNQGAGWAAAVTLYPALWARPTHALAAVRHDGRIHLFWSDDRRTIFMGSVNRLDVPFAAQRVVDSGAIAPDSALAAVSVEDGSLDLFWRAPDDRIMAASWTRQPGVATAWGAPYEVGGGVPADPSSSVAAVQINRSALQVFWERPDQSVWSTFGTVRPEDAQPWTKPVQVLPPGSVQQGSDLVAVSRAFGHVRLYVTDAAGQAAETWWGLTP